MRRIKFSLHDGVARKDVRAFLGLKTRDLLVASWKATGLQLQSGNLAFVGAGRARRRQGYNCNLGTHIFGSRPSWKGTGPTAIWELEFFDGRRS